MMELTVLDELIHEQARAIAYAKQCNFYPHMIAISTGELIALHKQRLAVMRAMPRANFFAVKPAINLHELVSKLNEHMPDGFWKTVLAAFDLMEIAEDEISKAMKKYPACKWLLYGSFMAIRNHMPMTPKLYRQHARELLNRIAKGDDINPATKAEVLTVLNQVSFILPLNNKPGTLYGKLFNELFPEFAAEFTDNPLKERYTGETNELHGELVAKLTVKRDKPYVKIPTWAQDEQ